MLKKDNNYATLRFGHNIEVRERASEQPSNSRCIGAANSKLMLPSISLASTREAR